MASIVLIAAMAGGLSALGAVSVRGSSFHRYTRLNWTNAAKVSVTAARPTAADAAGKTYNQLVLADSPVAFWRLGEARGRVVADLSGHGNTGSLAGRFKPTVPGLVRGEASTPVLDGKDSRMYFHASDSLRTGRALSFEAWLNPKAVPKAGGSGLLLVAEWNTALLYILGGSDPKFVFSVYDPGSATKGATAVAGTTSVVPGHLYYVVGSYDGSTMRIYVNGVLEATAPRSGLLKPSTFGGALTSGGWGSRSSPAFAGRLDDIAIYHKALSAEAVRSHYLTGAPVTYGSTVLADSPVAFWRLGDAQGRVVADSSGNGNAISAVSGVRLAAPGLLKDSKTSAVFDGANAKMYFQSSESLRAGRRLSLEAWVRPSTLPRISGSGWLLVGLWDTALLYIQGGTAPKFVFSLYGPGSAAHKTTVVASTTTVAPGQVYYIVGSYDGSTMRIYVNGVPEASNAHSGPIQNPRSGGALVSGGWGKRPSPAFDGRLDDIAIYNKALSSARVRQHYMQASRS